MDGRTSESPPVFYRTSSPSGPLPKKADMRSKRADLKTEMADLRLIRSNWRPEKADLQHETADFRPWGGDNQSPKSNIWSAIPRALLCIIVN